MKAQRLSADDEQRAADRVASASTKLKDAEDVKTGVVYVTERRRIEDQIAKEVLTLKSRELVIRPGKKRRLDIAGFHLDWLNTCVEVAGTEFTDGVEWATEEVHLEEMLKYLVTTQISFVCLFFPRVFCFVFT